jgi:hypothetical protein
MKATLGTPHKTSHYDDPIFMESHFGPFTDDNGNEIPRPDWEEGSGVKTNSYLYMFKNATVKVTSKDNETIDSLTVVCDDSSLDFSNLVCYWKDVSDKDKFGELKVTKEMVGSCRLEHLQTRWDNVLVLSSYLGSPTYDYETYFAYPDLDKEKPDKDNPESFIGGTIFGVCLSVSDTDAYYVYFQELR